MKTVVVFENKRKSQLKSKVFTNVVATREAFETPFDWIQKKKLLRRESDNYFLKCTSFEHNTPIAIP